MRRVHVFASIIAALSVAACATTGDEGDDPGITTPEVTGFTTSGSIGEIITTAAGRTYPNIQFNVRVTVRNTSESVSMFDYRTSCPVLVILYAADGRKVYDETGRECDTGATTLNVAAGGEQTLFSGIRFPYTVLGDSLSPGRYRVVALLQREAQGIHVEAGTYNIPLCDSQGCRPAPNSGAGADR